MPRFITKKWVEVHDQSGDANDRYKPNKPIRFKTSMLRSDLCDFSNAYIFVKGKISATDPNNNAKEKNYLLKIMHHFFLHLKKKWIHLQHRRFRCCYTHVQFT